MIPGKNAQSHSRAQKALVFVLVACLFSFAIYLKVRPEAGLSGEVRSGSSVIKLWGDFDQSGDTHVKLALVLVSFAFVLSILGFRFSRQWHPAPADAFDFRQQMRATSQHWFRPPPVPPLSL